MPEAREENGEEEEDGSGSRLPHNETHHPKANPLAEARHSGLIKEFGNVALATAAVCITQGSKNLRNARLQPGHGGAKAIDVDTRRHVSVARRIAKAQFDGGRLRDQHI